MEIVKLTPTNHQEVISQTIVVLKADGLVVFPSDTVYGLLADAQNPKAVEKLLAFKERRPGQAISVFVAGKNMAQDYIILNQNADNVINNLLPGPFTVIAESKHQTDPRLEAENNTLGIRIPDFPLILDLVRKFGRPITATSANLSGKPSVYSVEALVKTLSEKKKAMLNLIVDAGNLPKNKPSTVIDTTTGQLKTLRIGDLLPQTPNSLISNSEEETKQLARFLATKLIKKCPSKPTVFLLEGELGAGKTIFAKGLGEALGIQENIVSPTFNICNEYQIGQKPDSTSRLTYSDNVSPSQTITKLIHCDFYRLESRLEFDELSIFKDLACGNVYVIEWPERIPSEIISALKTTAEIVYLRLSHTGTDSRLVEWGFSES
ncbi:MAG: L-threonylcarbamoyladenylate synthase [Patescibacteria group bacterium]|jgi:L-threonylcarbamoyladenylate synthase